MRSLTFAALGATAVAACSPARSFVLVTVLSAHGEFPKVSQFLVNVKNGADTDALAYPKNPTPLRISEIESHSFTVSFSASREGDVTIGVTPLGPDGARQGFGQGHVALDPEHTVKVTILVQLGTSAGGDGGVPDAADAGTTPDGVLAGPCEPTNPVAGCGAMATCSVVCRSNDMGEGKCTTAGTQKTGEICTKNEDCAPGSQCFAFACMDGAGAAVKTCLHFCRHDPDCGFGAMCTTDVPCGKTPTGIKICSQKCDPRGNATTGCAAGLRCFIFAGEIPDCDCLGTSHLGGDGATCVDSRDCQPGFLCVSLSGNKCRPICRLDAPACASGRTCEKLQNPSYTTFGACLP